jgi:hypothetical protein
MSCCGQKRQEWLKEVKSSEQLKSNENTPDRKITVKPDRVFEYTGNNSFSIIGAASGNSYKFNFKGEKIKVDYFDSFALMAERDLKIIPIGQNGELI